MNSENLSDSKHVRRRSNSKSRKLTSQGGGQRVIPKEEAGNRPLPTNNQLATMSCCLGTCSALGVIGVLIVCVFQSDIFYYGGRIRPWVNGVIATSVLSVILGHLASRQIKRSGGKQNGQGLAFIGLILGYPIAVVLFLVPFLVMFLLTGFDGIDYLWNEFFG